MPANFEKRKYFQREYLLVSQYCAEQYQDKRVSFQQRVGPIQSELNDPSLTIPESMNAGNFRRRTDAVVLLPNEAIIIEGYIHVTLGKLSQLLVYLELFPHTPELGQFAKLPVRGILLGAQRDPILDKTAAKHGVEVVIFKPSWVEAFFTNADFRKTRDRQNANLG